jgi:hypothetical protein
MTTTGTTGRRRTITEDAIMDIGRIESETNATTTPLVVPRALIDFDVIATDGRVGRVHRDSANDDSHLVVRIRSFPFAKKRMIPTSTVSRVSWGGRQVFVQMTKNQVKSAPDAHRAWISSSDDWGGHSAYETNRDYDGLLRR